MQGKRPFPSPLSKVALMYLRRTPAPAHHPTVRATFIYDGVRLARVIAPTESVQHQRNLLKLRQVIAASLRPSATDTRDSQESKNPSGLHSEWVPPIQRQCMADGMAASAKSDTSC